MAEYSTNDLYGCCEEDYANLTQNGVPLVANVHGLKFSQAQSSTRRVLSRVRRPLPDLPVDQEITFSAADLPHDFKGIQKPEILINGCVNYSSCVSPYYRSAAAHLLPLTCCRSPYVSDLFQPVVIVFINHFITFQYLGTCQVKDMNDPAASREAIFKMKVISECCFTLSLLDTFLYGCTMHFTSYFI